MTALWTWRTDRALRSQDRQSGSPPHTLAGVWNSSWSLALGWAEVCDVQGLEDARLPGTRPSNRRPPSRDAKRPDASQGQEPGQGSRARKTAGSEVGSPVKEERAHSRETRRALCSHGDTAPPSCLAEVTLPGVRSLRGRPWGFRARAERVGPEASGAPL